MLLRRVDVSSGMRHMRQLRAGFTGDLALAGPKIAVASPHKGLVVVVVVAMAVNSDGRAMQKTASAVRRECSIQSASVRTEVGEGNECRLMFAAQRSCGVCLSTMRAPPTLPALTS
jgi:hypothetical protein